MVFRHCQTLAFPVTIVRLSPSFWKSAALNLSFSLLHRLFRSCLSPSLFLARSEASPFSCLSKLPSNRKKQDFQWPQVPPFPFFSSWRRFRSHTTYTIPTVLCPSWSTSSISFHFLPQNLKFHYILLWSYFLVHNSTRSELPLQSIAKSALFANWVIRADWSVSAQQFLCSHGDHSLCRSA